MSSTTATFASRINPAGQTTTYRVFYDLANSSWCSSNGTSGQPTYSTEPQTLPYTDGTLHDAWASVSGLVSGTSYCAKLKATNASATTAGELVRFTLGVPGVNNDSVAVTGPTSATVNGAVNAFGQAPVDYGAIYDLASSGFCASGGSIPDATTQYAGGSTFAYSDFTFHPVSLGLTALTASTNYCATIYAVSPAVGVSTQAVPIYFTTAAAVSR